jgi:Tfp pilus assembly protein PilF
VLELDPNYAMAHTYLGQVFVEKRMYDEAIEEFQKAITF